MCKALLQNSLGCHLKSSIGHVGWKCYILDQAFAQVTHTDDGLALAAANCKILQLIMVLVPQMLGLKRKVD